MCNRIFLERRTIEGDSFVSEINLLLSSILSIVGLEKFCGNLLVLFGKAKYFWETDSELVLWGKGEKNFE